MTTKFTEGPWHWDGNVCDYDRENEAPWIVNGENKAVLRGEIKCDNPADAALLVSAPELYEALEELAREEFRDDSDPILGRARHKARAALAKARGEA